MLSTLVGSFGSGAARPGGRRLRCVSLFPFQSAYRREQPFGSRPTGGLTRSGPPAARSSLVGAHPRAEGVGGVRVDKPLTGDSRRTHQRPRTQPNRRAVRRQSRCRNRSGCDDRRRTLHRTGRGPSACGHQRNVDAPHVVRALECGDRRGSPRVGRRTRPARRLTMTKLVKREGVSSSRWTRSLQESGGGMASGMLIAVHQAFVDQSIAMRRSRSISAARQSPV